MSEFLKELWLYARERKKYWLLPLIVVLTLIGLLIFTTQAVVTSPFIYTLF
ncbi:MAG: uncharacterized protein K0Q68_1451 [Moraxellaceae bacterium]|jgi:hypothetical protein|nr:uncharacterized protein [Moraxellaceae bacterium]